MVWIWLGVVISLLLTEYLSRNFTAICFAISAVVSCILTKFTANYMIQLGEFLMVGILLIAFARPFLLKKLGLSKNHVVQLKHKNNRKRKENKNKK